MGKINQLVKALMTGYPITGSNSVNHNLSAIDHNWNFRMHQDQFQTIFGLNQTNMAKFVNMQQNISS